MLDTSINTKVGERGKKGVKRKDRMRKEGVTKEIGFYSLQEDENSRGL